MSDMQIPSLTDAGDDTIRIFISGSARINPKAASFGCVFAWKKIVKELYGYVPKSTRQYGDLMGAKEALMGILIKDKKILIYTDSSYAEKVIRGKSKCDAHKKLLKEIQDIRRTFTGSFSIHTMEDVNDPMEAGFVLRSAALAAIAMDKHPEDIVTKSFVRRDWFTHQEALGLGLQPPHSSTAQPPEPSIISSEAPISDTDPHKNTSKAESLARIKEFFGYGKDTPRLNQSCCLYVHLPSLNLPTISDHNKMIKLLAAYLEEEGLSVYAGYSKPWKDIQQYRTKQITTIKEFYHTAGFISLNKGGIEGNVSYVVRTNPEIKDIVLIGNTDLVFSDIVTSELRQTARFFLACDAPERVRAQENFTGIVNLGYLMRRI